MNANTISVGYKKEAVRGVEETLTDANFSDIFIDAERVQMSPDTSVVGKKANGSMINSAKSYVRTVAGTMPIKTEVGVPASATAPEGTGLFEAAGFHVDVIDAGTNDNYGIFYEGNPECVSITIETHIEGCTTGCSNGLRGATISDGTFTIDGAGAPMTFTGTATGAYIKDFTDAPATITDTTDGCAVGTGLVFTYGGVVYNITKLELKTNLGTKIVTDMAQADGTNIAYTTLSDGGDPTMTWSAFAIDSDCSGLIDKYLANQVEGVTTLENDQYKIIISDMQIVDIQSENDGGEIVTNQTMKIGSFSIQFK